MKIRKEGNKFYNKSGRFIAEIIDGQIHISQKDFRRAIKKIRELTDIKFFYIN